MPVEPVGAMFERLGDASARRWTADADASML